MAASCPLAQPLTPIEPLHGQSILEVLRTRPLTAPAPGGDRRLSGEALHVGGHSHRSDHDPHGSLPGLQGRPTGARTGMRLRRGRAHLYTYDLHCVHGQRRARCVPDRKVISGQSRSATGTANRPLPAATQVIELAERSLQAGSRFGPVQQRPLTATGLHFHQQPPLAATAANVPALPLVRDEEANADSVSVGHTKEFESSSTLIL